MATISWNSAVSGNWSDAADWSGDTVPGSGDTVSIGPGLSAAAGWTVAASDAFAGTLLLDAGAFGTLSPAGLLDVAGSVTLASGVVDLQPSATLATPGALTLGAVTSAATLYDDAGGLIAASALALYGGSVLDLDGAEAALGDGIPTAGTLMIGSDATLSADAGTIDGDVTTAVMLSVNAPQPGEAGNGVLSITGTLHGSADIAAGASLYVGGDLFGNLALAAGAAATVAGNVTLSLGAQLLITAADLTVAGALLATSASVEVDGGNVSVGGGLTLSATTLDVAGGTLAVAGTLDIAYGPLNNYPYVGSALIIAGGAALVTATSLVNDGSISIGAGATLTVAGTLSGYSAGISVASGASLGVGGMLSGQLVATNAQISTGAAGTLYAKLAGGTLAVSTGTATIFGSLASNAVLTAPSLTLLGFGLTGGSAVTVQSLDINGGLSVDATSSAVVGTAAPVAGALNVGSDGIVTFETGDIGANVLLAGTLDVASIYQPPLHEPSDTPGDLSISGNLTGDGTIDVITTAPSYVAGSLFILTDASGFTGSVVMQSGAALELQGGDIAGATITPDWTSHVEAHPKIDIWLPMAYAAYNVPLYDAANGLLTVGTQTLDVGTGDAAGDFSVSGNISYTDVTITPCYAAGTRIATPDGEIPVEDLRPGDLVLTLGGAARTPRPVRWVGRFSVDLARHPAPDNAAPVLIRADAVAPGVPRRDLRVSPDHAVLIDGALIQAQALVNGITVVRDRAARAVTYLHVELDRHGILFAEGLPAESYLDTGNRGAFHGEAGARPLFPDLASARTWHSDACAELVLAGPRVAAAHAALRARAEQGWLTADPALVVLADGVRLPLRREAALWWQATLPAGTRDLRLRSRSFVPSLLDPGGGDDRRLGLAVICLTCGGYALPPSRYGAGWHAAEAGHRWTDGDATVLPPALPHAARLRIGAVAAGARYLVEPAPHDPPEQAAQPQARHRRRRRA